MEEITLIVWKKANGQKHVTIPKGCDIQAGDPVKIIKFKEDTNNERSTTER